MAGRETAMAAKMWVAAHFMHEHEEDAARRLLDVKEVSGSYLLGWIDEGRLQELRDRGLIVDVLEQPASAGRSTYRGAAGGGARPPAVSRFPAELRACFAGPPTASRKSALAGLEVALVERLPDPPIVVGATDPAAAGLEWWLVRVPSTAALRGLGALDFVVELAQSGLPSEPAVGGGRPSPKAAEPLAAFPEAWIAHAGVEIADELDLVASARRGEATGLVDVSVDLEGDEAYVVAVRQASGALTFHAPVEEASERRSAGAKARRSVRFQVPTRASGAGRRGLVSAAVKVFLLRVAGAVADRAMPVVARIWEQRCWDRRGLAEGWRRVDADGLRSGKLRSASAASLAAPGRRLLLLHGTFSTTASAFAGLGASGFLDRVAPIYGDRVFGFDHFTVSRTPEENARAILEALPDGGGKFDVVTHSRGGLVLRTLVERRSELGSAASRFELGHGVLVASPNGGTPLASPRHWDATLGWVASLLELFPENPFTTGAELLGEAIVWLARRVAGALPGIASMDPGGETVESLQEPPHPPAGAYSALVANHAPDAGVLRRMADVGADWFFGGANDLVVPTDGGWALGRDGGAVVPPERIGCFGRGGNLASADAVHHLGILDEPAAAEFIAAALGAAGGRRVAPFGPGSSRALGGAVRGRGVRGGAGAAAGADADGAAMSAGSLASADASYEAAGATRDTFHLMVLQPEKDGASHLLAMYRNARVVEPFPTSGKANAAGRRFQAIIRTHESLKSYIDGDVYKRGKRRGQRYEMPDEARLRAFGELLFDALLPGDVRRLYDAARASQEGRRLDFIFTSMIPWIADKPWEFAFDTSRRTHLATQDIHFVRNVLTAVPAQRVPPSDEPLRILVVAAQPVGSAALSVDEEEALIARGFEGLVRAGLASIEVLRCATPPLLHQRIWAERFDVVHFIGHGEFDEEAGRGHLLFEDGRGGARRLDDRELTEILCGRGIRLVFLNACETGRGGRADFNRGVAPALVAGGLPAVVANQYKVLDVSATAFAQVFYRLLAQGGSIGESAREARIAVNYSISAEDIDWAVPVVYARAPSDRLCARRTVDAPELLGLGAGVRRRRSAEPSHDLRVGVWDVGHGFPALAETLDHLDAVQNRYGFELLTNEAPPIGTWQLESSESEPYIHAEAMEKRLLPRVAELGLDYLFCLTQHWLRDDHTLNLYGWWPGKGGKVLILSTAGFALPSRGRETDRAIANAVVTCLAGTLVDRDAHKRGPKRCPFFFDVDRDYELLTGLSEFDARCRRSLARSIPDDLPALEAILNAFA